MLVEAMAALTVLAQSENPTALRASASRLHDSCMAEPEPGASDFHSDLLAFTHCRSFLQSYLDTADWIAPSDNSGMPPLYGCPTNPIDLETARLVFVNEVNQRPALRANAAIDSLYIAFNTAFPCSDGR